VIPNDGPLLSDTQIYGLVDAVSPYLDEGCNVYRGPDGRVTQLITLLTITGGEVAVYRRDGIDALLDRLEDPSVDLFDVLRPSTA
jgi:Suppressor of fused protein (SUFU)